MTPPYLLNDNSFLFFKNDLGIYAKLLDCISPPFLAGASAACLNDTSVLLNDIYAATPFLRINFKEQSCCLTAFGSFLWFKNVNRVYAKLDCFSVLVGKNECENRRYKENQNYRVFY